MQNIISSYYKDYVNTKKNFEDFHNNVINMPRGKFSEIDELVKLIKSIAGYIILIDNETLSNVLNYKILYAKLLENYRHGIFPENNRNIEFEDYYFNVAGDIDEVYNERGRYFRHYMEYLLFFGAIKNGDSKQKKYVDIDTINELVLSSNENVFDILRSKLLSVNINSNDLINNLDGITCIDGADYCPAKNILSYCKHINRDVTAFEISILFGRVDKLQKNEEILKRAIDIGEILPDSYVEQKNIFFNSMNWKGSDGTMYDYAQSQQPEFKFKVFLLFMKTFKLINYDETTNVISLTDYGKSLVDEDISPEMLDLANLLVMIDDDSEDSNKLIDVVIRKRTSTITKAIEEDGEIVVKINKRSIRKPIIKNGKRVRSPLIRELAKVKAGYLDELTGQPSFEGKNGNNYVEAHHIIEFSTENGPDITDNLICLGPQNHSLIHHGSNRAVGDFYRSCQTRGIITLNRFKNICTNYRCLTNEHVDALLAKQLISTIDAQELRELIRINGVDENFLNSLSIPSRE